MKQFSLGIGGFLGFFLSLTLFGQVALYTIATLYACMLYLLFFRGGKLGFPLLIGLTIGGELLGTSRFGGAVGLASIALLLFYIFCERLRFTSLFVRYIVALFLLLVSYDLLLFSLRHAAERMLPIVVLYVVACFTSFLVANRSAPTTYELI